MEPKFWHERWERGQIGFHRSAPHGFLKRYFSQVAKSGSKVFVPLCGKSNDMLWLLNNGYQVFGVELSEEAVKQFFADNELEPQVTTKVTSNGEFIEYALDELVIWVGDVFNLSGEDLATIDAWYDRGALVALPPEMRKSYVTALSHRLPDEANGLLITVEYPSGYRQGPPFSVSEGEIEASFGQRFSVEELESDEGIIDGKNPEDNPTIERVYKLS